MPELPEQFVLVFKQHYPTVVRQLIALVHDRTIAEDLAQETFLRLYRKPPDDLSRIGPWLYRVAMRLGYDHLRSVHREQKLSLASSEQPDTIQVQPSGEESFMQKLDREDVLNVLGRLSDRDRQVLLLRHSGYSYVEIAHVLGVNKSIVGTMLNRALSRFKQAYEQEDGVQHG
ncbi:RNA polymerase sigma factor SigX [Alicyclobacillus dauci]|uniref:RNA polymerase sigma factor SigX n=1 Tax=Alicyclobacillus dauci TaxID=1475485 RepID=A0ABY6Z2I1_9BACL|nr:RNA polymerase sigma factor SigX [Alicyclobacillus dauci]WAH36723.1 RNA polymerase sigma factor SigX [Alicyclobacillus dauci]